MKLGKMHEAKVLGEAGSNGGGTTGTADFPYAKVYLGNSNNEPIEKQDTCSAKIIAQGYECCPSDCETIYTDDDGDWGVNNNQWCGCGNKKTEPKPIGSCSVNILNQGYECCPSDCEVIYTDNDGDWGVNNNQWCGCGNRTSVPEVTCSSNIKAQGYKCCSANCIVYYTDADGDWGIENDEWCGCGNSKSTTTVIKTTTTTNKTSTTQASVNTNFCSNAKHSGESVKITSNKVGSINGIGYELWADSGNNSATFYSDGSFSCTFQNAKDYLCRSGLSFDSTKTHDQLGHMYADFKLVKQNIQNVDYSYIGVYGWSRSPLV
jgi:predicted RNase H-like HicB family nuclease